MHRVGSGHMEQVTEVEVDVGTMTTFKRQIHDRHELSGLKGLFYGPATLRLCDSGLGKSVYGDAGILTYFCSRLKTFASLHWLQETMSLNI